ncbi:hypothetical protein LU676_18270 [Pseudomonas alloputida]|uniref:hypothetical protein n=1 Tax=Pseudomonas alloputida TaxID=1940621 RepID=UPI001E28B73E|nr:hypothetical protein [Pseudomonas alloputida]MCE0904688.1 hypothetical protein [Pseudomonas alloputida]
MTTQQVVALFVICAFIIGLFAYAYFLGRKASRANHTSGLLFDSAPCTGQSRPGALASPQIWTSEGSEQVLVREPTDPTLASLRETSSIDAQKTKSLCCEAAGIIHPLSSPAEALTPHDKLREAPPAAATLIAIDRSHAQPAGGYTHPSAVSCIVAAMDATLAEQAGTYATSEQMAQAIEAALQQAGFLSPTDEAWQVVRARLDESLINREAEQRKHHHSVANLKRTIAELQERSLAVTKSDYALLMESSRTLRVAEQTMKALKSQVANQAAEQAAGLQAIAKRVHAQLRSTPATLAHTEEAA